MQFIPINKFNLDSLVSGKLWYSRSQRWIDPGTAIIAGSAIVGGSSLAGGLLGGGSKSPSVMSTLSPHQKQIDKYLFDFLLGVTRDSRGNELSRNPLLTRMMDKQMPQMRVAPLTGNQKAGLATAQKFLGQIQNPIRPDQDLMRGLARGQLPTEGAATGAVLREGEKAVVGEDGTEMIEVMAGGKVKVIPNPKSVSSPKNIQEALAKSKKEIAKYGADMGMVAGLPSYTDTPETKRKYGDYFVNYNSPGYTAGTGGNTGNYWDDTQAWTPDARSEFEGWLGENKADELWYKNLSSGNWGEGIGNVQYATPLKGVPLGAHTAQGAIHAGYNDALQEWWNTLPTATGNTAVTDLFNTTMQGTQDEKYDWLVNQGNWNDPMGNAIGIRNGVLDLQDPYSSDMGTLTALADEYNTWYSTEGPGKPVEEAPAPYDYTNLMSQITPDQYDAYNKYLKDYEGGVLGDAGIALDPTTGQYTVNAAEGYGPGMEKATTDFLAAQEAAANAPEPTEPTPEEQTDTAMDSLYAALAENIKPFDATSANQAFDEGVYQPEMKKYEENTKPALLENIPQNNLFGSQRDKTLLKSRQDLEDALSSERATYIANAEQAHKNRAISAMSLGMDLAQLPASIASAEADIDYKKAASASIFANIETQNALTNSSITNDQLLGLVTLMQIFGEEQDQTQTEWNVAMQNALNNIGEEEGINQFTTLLLSMLSGTPYQDQSQMAVAS